MLTGEPMPLEKSVEDQVAGGTLNKSGTFLFRATHVGRDTALSRIVEMVRQAQGAKPAIGRLADTVSAYFVPVVLICGDCHFRRLVRFRPHAAAQPRHGCRRHRAGHRLPLRAGSGDTDVGHGGRGQGRRVRHPDHAMAMPCNRRDSLLSWCWTRPAPSRRANPP